MRHRKTSRIKNRMQGTGFFGGTALLLVQILAAILPLPYAARAQTPDPTPPDVQCTMDLSDKLARAPVTAEDLGMEIAKQCFHGGPEYGSPLNHLYVEALRVTANAAEADINYRRQQAANESPPTFLTLDNLIGKVGRCGPESHVAVGAIGTDLTKHQKAFTCDRLASVKMDGAERYLIQFATTTAGAEAIIGFAGYLMAPDFVAVDHLYLRGVQYKPDVAVCKFYPAGSVLCTAKLDQRKQRTAVIVTFRESSYR